MRFPLSGLGLGAAILSGCSVQRAPSVQGRTVVRVWSMWAGDEERVFQGVVDYYNRVQKKVYLQNLGAAADDKILRAVTAGAPPDFFTLREPGYLAPLAANGALLPLDEWFQSAGFHAADFVPGALELGRYKGKLYSMPYLLDAMALFYNPDHLRRAGIPPDRPPQTLEQLLGYARQLTVRDRRGAIRTLGLRPPDLIYIIGAFGGQFVDPRTGAPTADHPINLEAARYYRALIEAMGEGKALQAFTMSFGNEQGTNNPFFLGKIALMINGQWNTYWFQKYAPDVPYGIAPIPYPAGKPHLRQPTWIGQNMFCIPRESRHPTEAWDFFVWMQSEEAQLLFAETMHGLPNIRRVLKHPRLRTASRPSERWKQGYTRFLELVDSPNARYFPITPIAALYLNELSTAQDYLISGNKTPEQALRDVQARLIAEYRRWQ